MKNSNLILKTLRKCIIAISCLFCFNLVIAQSNYYFYPGTSSDQRLYGDNDKFTYINSNNSNNSGIIFRDKENEIYGRVQGYIGADSYFGLKDGDGSWSYLAVKDKSTQFKINGNEKMRIQNNGNVGIGTNAPQNKLDVCGTIKAEEVLVEDGWCDFVFEPEYCLTTLEEEADFIKMYGHLSNFESAKEMDGLINVNDIFKRQQVQIEENVLHLIKLSEENKALQNQVNILEERLAALEVK